MAFDEVKKLYTEACIMKNNLDMGKPLPEGWSEEQVLDNFQNMLEMFRHAMKHKTKKTEKKQKAIEESKGPEIDYSNYTTDMYAKIEDPQEQWKCFQAMFTRNLNKVSDHVAKKFGN